MPADAVLSENFKDYVLGAYDGVPKTPAWAEEITGAPAADIAWFAEKVSKDHKVMLHHSYPSGRCNGAENLPQLFMTIGAMGGHMGKSGHATGSMYNYEAANGGPRLIRVGSLPSGYVPNPLDDVVSGPVQWKSIVDGHYTHVGKNTMVSMNLWAPAEERELDIKFIWAANNNELQARMDVNMGIEAFRKVEFVLAANYIPSLTCQYADIVLPVVTRWEGNHSVWMPTWINRESQVFNFPVVEEPLYEAKPDEVYCKELAERLGAGHAGALSAGLRQAVDSHACHLRGVRRRQAEVRVHDESGGRRGRGRPRRVGEAGHHHRGRPREVQLAGGHPAGRPGDDRRAAPDGRLPGGAQRRRRHGVDRLQGLR